MSSLILNTLLVDYVSATFFNDTSPNLYPQLNEQLPTLLLDAKVREHVARLQYTGWLRAGKDGSVYLGTGTQKDKPHTLLQVSGSIANAAWESVLKELALRGDVRITRLDVQVTVPKPDDIDLRGLYSIATVHHKTVSLVSSSSAENGELRTLYIGARVSDTFWRIYEKADTLGGIAVRAEVELKGATANQVPRFLREGGTLEDVYKQKLRKLHFSDFARHFIKGIDNGLRYIVVRADTQTGKWLRETVIPALSSYLQQAEDADEVATMFGDIIVRYWDYRDRI